ncbi:MAG: GNAT family N-acetyltransferase [Candidatus Cloacimonetes bacterium]|nr:GNAT family N-acetyltransferase [Candidatus Cloacimonadota bacterium]
MKKQFRVFLRALEPEDYEIIHKWRNDDEVALFFSGTRRFTSTLNEKKWLEDRIFDRNSVSCVTCLKETGEAIGCVFINSIDLLNKNGVSGCFIGEKQHWSKGYATDALILMLKHVFYDKGLERVWAGVFEENTASLRMAEKCGYKVEGLMRKGAFVDGEFKNIVIVGVLREDFEKVLEQYEV